MLCPVAPRSFISTIFSTSSSCSRILAFTVHGKFVARTWLSITGPATPKPAASTKSVAMYGAPCRENSRAISSKWANSLLANRCLNTVVNLPSFSENSARLHFVPPTSPARITWPPDYEVNRESYCTCVRGLWLRVEPLPAFVFEESIGLSRAPASRGILRDIRGLRRAPNIENRVDQRPRRLDAVAAIEQRRVTAHAIVQQRGVGTARAIAKSLPIAEIHGDVADAHLRPRSFRPKGHRNAFIRLNV